MPQVAGRRLGPSDEHGAGDAAEAQTQGARHYNPYAGMPDDRPVQGSAEEAHEGIFVKAGLEHGSETGEEASSAGREPEEEREEVEATRVDLIIACMLLGGTIFVLTFLNLIGNHDPDIKLHAYMVLNFTTSIFTAVLIFQSLSGFLHSLLASGNEGLELGIGFFAKLLEALGWYCGLQAVMWHFVSGLTDESNDNAVGKIFFRRAIAWCTLLTHIAAFAAISSFRDLQDLLMLCGAPGVFTFLPVWLSAAMCFGLFRLADYVRSVVKVSTQGHEKWDAVVEEAENDFAGLVISFLNVQAFIDCLLGPPPSRHDDKHGHLDLRDRPEAGDILMFGLAHVFAGLTIAMTWYIAKRERSGYTPGRIEDEMGKFISHSGFDPKHTYIKRWLFILQGVCAMSFAWCLLFAVKWTIAKLLGGDGFILHSDSTGQSVVLALVVSFIAFALIYVLDKVQDLEATGDVADRCTRSIMGALAILIGFSWEQSFDKGFEVIAELTAESGFWLPLLLKLIFVVVVVTSLVPAWRTHILKAMMDLEEEVRASRGPQDVTETCVVESGSQELDNEEIAPTFFCFACNGPKQRSHAFQ